MKFCGRISTLCCQGPETCIIWQDLGVSLWLTTRVDSYVSSILFGDIMVPNIE